MNNEIMTFEFSESKFPVRNILIDDEPWFVAKDVCDVLGLEDTNKALLKLDDDEKLTRKLFVSGQNRKIWLISESGLYALVLRSNKPYAKIFRKWVTSEVVPSLRKTGRYKMKNFKEENDFIDARDIAYEHRSFQGHPIRCITIDSETWLSMNDIHKSIGSRTDSTQAARKLNRKQSLAQKIWIFGNTKPAWFVTLKGLNLMLCSSKIFKFEKSQLSELPVKMNNHGI